MCISVEGQFEVAWVIMSVYCFPIVLRCRMYQAFDHGWSAVYHRGRYECSILYAPSCLP
jgi:hypothetical protein